MTARITARLTTSFLLMGIAFVAFLLLMDAPASAHHRTEHIKIAPAGTTDGGEVSGTNGSTAPGRETDKSTIESSAGSTADSKGKAGSSDPPTDSSSSSSDSSSSSTDKHSERSSEGIAKHGFDPDPVQTPSPIATKGPLACPTYDDGDAGPYDADNCDGTQGLHGNGGNGKCAGCTGKADDKWPRGQYVGDHNNGYECDHNGGIGKGNPAHSRCATAPPPPCVTNCNPPPPCVRNCNPPPPCVKNCNPPDEDDDVKGEIHTDIDEPLAGRTPPKGRPPLPFTGATVGSFLWLALLLMGAGSLLLWRFRDRGAAV